MRSANSRLLTAGAVLVAAAASAAAAAPGALSRSDEPSTVVRVDGHAYEERRDDRDDRGRGVVVDAPYAHVDAGDPVIVDAPGTHVGVHRDRIRVIAPFVNLSIPR